MDNPTEDRILKRWEEEEKQVREARQVAAQAERPRKRPRRAIEATAAGAASNASAFGGILDEDGEGFIVGEVEAEDEATVAGSEAGRRRAGARKPRS